MVELIDSNENSYSIYLNVSRIYQSEFLPECRTFHMLSSSAEMAQRLRSGASIESLLEEMSCIYPDKLCLEIPTKTGVHLITDPFDCSKFKDKYPFIEIHKNSAGALLYSAWLFLIIYIFLYA